MAIIVRTPQNAFIRWNEADSFHHPIYGEVKYCLPIYSQNDASFSFVLEGATEGETETLLDLGNNAVTLGIVNDTGDPFLLAFSDKPERFRISERQVLYIWGFGLPDFDTVIDIDECFKLRLDVAGGGVHYSNCFQRIASDEFTSVVEFGSDENAFGFNYCQGDAVEEDSDHCEDGGAYGGGSYGGGGSTIGCDPTYITFLNEATLSIPYTAFLAEKYGDVPSIQTWIYDGAGNLVNAGITASMDNVPPTVLSWDFGGIASGVIRLGQ